MKRKLTAILLVLTLCFWYAPAGIWNSVAHAGEPTWTGGNSGCKHESFTGRYEYQDENYHTINGTMNRNEKGGGKNEKIHCCFDDRDSGRLPLLRAGRYADRG